MVNEILNYRTTANFHFDFRIATILKRDSEFVCSGTLVTTQKVVTGKSTVLNFLDNFNF